MNADRLEFFRNQLRGVPVADLGRMMWQVLMQATDEAERDEREACAKLCDMHAIEPMIIRQTKISDSPRNVFSKDCAALIRARGDANVR